MINLANLIGMRSLIIFESGTQENITHNDITYSDYIFKPIGREYFNKDQIFAQKNRAKKFFQRIDTGCKCYGFFNGNDRVVSYVWASVALPIALSVPLTYKLNLKLNSGNAYLWDCFTSPEYRRQGFYRQGLIKAKSICLKNGAKRVYMVCDRGNTISKAGILSAGFEEISRLFIFRFGHTYLIKKSRNPLQLFRKGQELDIN